MELEDDTSADDMPDDPQVLANGYNNDNAYFIGNAALNALNLDGKTVQICAGVKSSCAVDCHEINAKQVGSQISRISWPTPAPADDFKKLIAAIAGQSRTAHSADYFWCGTSTDANGCTLAGSWNGPWGSSWAYCQSGASNYIRGMSKHAGGLDAGVSGAGAAWHIWGCGVSMYYGINKEIGMWDTRAGPDMFQ